MRRGRRSHWRGLRYIGRRSRTEDGGRTTDEYRRTADDRRFCQKNRLSLMLLTAHPFRTPLALRAHLRLVLLAAAEACWMYAALLTFSMIAGIPHEVSHFGILLLYWAGRLTGRRLPRSKLAWRVLQFATIAIA